MVNAVLSEKIRIDDEDECEDEELPQNPCEHSRCQTSSSCHSSNRIDVTTPASMS